MRKIAIIGGGASGMMAAITAAYRGAVVTIYEKNDRVGKKILATGNGKCNFSNLNIGNNSYRGGDINKVNDILERFSPKDCMDFFADKGMLIKNKDGYLYPASEQASTVLDILRMQLNFYNINIITECEIVDIKSEDNGNETTYILSGILNGKKKCFKADAVVLSCGSLAGIPLQQQKGKNVYDILSYMNLPVVTVVPALVQLRCKEEFMKSVAGVRVDGEVTLYADDKEICRERGEVQLTDYGISGIPVFQLSRYAAYALHEKKRVSVSLNVLPSFTDEEYAGWYINRNILNEGQTAEEYFLGIANKKLLLLFMKLSGIKPTEKIINVSIEKKNNVFKLMRGLNLTVTGTNPFEKAQVCAGGLAMDAVDDNLQIMKYPGIYATGELMDVDGRCGGYNLQWAFASGYVAGYNAAEG